MKEAGSLVHQLEQLEGSEVAAKSEAGATAGASEAVAVRAEVAAVMAVAARARVAAAMEAEAVAEVAAYQAAGAALEAPRRAAQAGMTAVGATVAGVVESRAAEDWEVAG